MNTQADSIWMALIISAIHKEEMQSSFSRDVNFEENDLKQLSKEPIGDRTSDQDLESEKEIVVVDITAAATAVVAV
ncbi:Hypothetical predicted protein [Octopus vulgaris]|uniref:Uncharacterized protein n=1 Tax=Octopus vulgaris TaxID=6645 RepID=A0AA36F4E7_OCTVU|nr:Hypothetical predicted protein [Octopus vulgaris]